MQPLGVNKVQKCTFWKEVPLIPAYCDTLCWFVVSKWKKKRLWGYKHLLWYIVCLMQRSSDMFLQMCACVHQLQWSLFNHDHTLLTQERGILLLFLHLGRSVCLRPQFALRFELYCFTLASFYASVSFKHNRFTSYMHGPTAERNKALNVEACSRD